MSMKRLPLVVLGALAFSMTACGGGSSGDENAFCDSLDTLSDQVADGDLADDNGLDDVTDTVNDLLESAADGDQLDAVNAVGDEVEGASADDADNTAETIQDELGDFADDCNIDSDEFAVAPTTTETTDTTETSETTDTTDDTGTTDTTDGGGGGGVEDINVGARQPVPADLEAEFSSQAQQCFDGDAPVCDDLFAQTPVGSVAENYGETCAGRITEGTPGVCAQVITAPQAPPTDIVDQANARSCFDGDMNACDDLFRNADDGGTDQLYGALCGLRVATTDAFCVDIFGEQAIF
jgi:hypothetical protein